MTAYSYIFESQQLSADKLRTYLSFNEMSDFRHKSLAGLASAFVHLKHEDLQKDGLERRGLVFDGFGPPRHIVESGRPKAETPEEKTLSLQFKLDDHCGNRTQILLETGTGKSGLNIYIQGADLVLGAWNKGVWESFLSTPVPTDGHWHHVALTYSSPGETGAVHAFLDGVLAGTSDVGELGPFPPHMTLGGTSGGTRIDGGQLPGSNRFSGELDEIAVFDRALSTDEVAVMAAVIPITLTGTEGNDEIFGTDANENIYALGGDDWVVANGGSDRVFGGDGDDRLEGGEGLDILRGQGGNDQIVGGADTDRLLGGEGDDQLFGDEGNDWLQGDAGDDLLDGGEGLIDTAVYEGPSSGYEVNYIDGVTTLDGTAAGDGIDQLINIERIQFADVSLTFNTDTLAWEKIVDPTPL